jgi:hypothetical protein
MVSVLICRECVFYVKFIILIFNIVCSADTAGTSQYIYTVGYEFVLVMDRAWRYRVAGVVGTGALALLGISLTE